MRNLKRAMSLALASTVLMSTMAMGATAANFPDADEIVNAEAVTILNLLDVLKGRDTGDFDPTAVVTRAEMAAILCRVMEGADVDTAIYAGLSGLSDVDGHWADGYIGMASYEGWVLGHDDGSFTPDAPVTTSQAAIMIQRALGYFSDKDDTVNPSNYILDAYRLGTTLELFDGITTGATQGLNRDEVAVMVYNMMFNTMRVRYSTANELYYAVDVDSPNANSTDVTVQHDRTIAALNFDVSIEGDTDSLGRPIRNIVIEDTVMATSVVDYTAIFADPSDLADVSNKMTQAPTDDSNLMLNGKVEKVEKVFDEDDVSEAGIVIQVYEGYDAAGDQDEDETLYVAYTYKTGEVKKVSYDQEDNETSIRIDTTNYTMTGTTTYEVGDEVMFTAGGNQIASIQSAKTVEGEVTSTSTKFARLDGTIYYFTSDNMLTASQLGDTYALYLNPYGYVISAQEVEANSAIDANYLVVLAAQSSLNEVTAKVILADGTQQIVTIGKINGYNATSVNGTGNNTLTYDADDYTASVFTYQISDGKYQLTDATATAAAADVYIKNGHITTVDEDGKSTGSFLEFDNETIFVDVENGVVYVGFETVPNYTSFASGDLFYVDNVVFMISGSVEGQTEDGHYVYLADTDHYITKLNDTVYNVYENAYVDGTLMKNGLFSQVEITAAGLYELELDEDGYVTAIAQTVAIPDAGEGDETRTVGSATIYTESGARYTYDEDSVFVLVDVTGDETTVMSGSADDLIISSQSEAGDDMTELLVVSDDDGNILLAYIILSEKVDSLVD